MDPLAIYSNVTTIAGGGYSHGGTADQSANLITRLVAEATTVTTLPGVGSVTGFRFSVSRKKLPAVAKPKP